MKYIPLSQGKQAIVDDDLYESLSGYRWFVNNGYARCWDGSGRGRKIILMHRVILNTPEGLCTDHINGDRLDNRRENLRVCTKAENSRNRGVEKTNTSGFKGVNWHKRDRVWQARLNYLGKFIWLGSYKTKEEAALAYNRGAIELHGEFACLNEVEC